jgi:hypothetical protein
MNRKTLAILLAAVLPLPMLMAQQTDPVEKDKTQATQVAPNPVEFDKRMAQVQESMKKMQEQITRIQQTQDPQERQRLLQEHLATMRASMGMMNGMWGSGMLGGRAMMGGPMMGGPMMMGGRPMMGWSTESGYYSKLTPEQLRQRQYMTDRYLAMQQMMMDHMMWHQYWMLPQQPPAS